MPSGHPRPEVDKLSNEEVLDKLEAELNSPLRKTKRHPNHKTLRMLSAKEEMHYQKVRKKRGLKAKGYDGRVANGNKGNVSLIQTR